MVRHTTALLCLLLCTTPAWAQTAAGKTSLVEALLWKAGAIGTPGSLERGTTVCDFDPMERRAQQQQQGGARHSLSATGVQLAHEAANLVLFEGSEVRDLGLLQYARVSKFTRGVVRRPMRVLCIGEHLLSDTACTTRRLLDAGIVGAL